RRRARDPRPRRQDAAHPLPGLVRELPELDRRHAARDPEHAAERGRRGADRRLRLGSAPDAVRDLARGRVEELDAACGIALERLAGAVLVLERDHAAELLARQLLEHAARVAGAEPPLAT